MRTWLLSHELMLVRNYKFYTDFDIKLAQFLWVISLRAPKRHTMNLQ